MTTPKNPAAVDDRSPLDDPYPGDIVQFAGAKLFVQGISHGRVHYKVNDILDSYVTLREWVQCVKNATVVYVAEKGGTPRRNSEVL
jgi:hypothetical protein